MGQCGLIILIMTAVMAALPAAGAATDRCAQYASDVRAAHSRYFGPAFPWWYGLGQLKQESCCRAEVTAFDSGMGIAQFMPKTSRYIQSLMGESLNPYNPKHAVRMQAFYMARIHAKENWNGALFLDYQIYNGGRGSLYREFQKAGCVDWAKMKEACQRKKIKMKWGVLDLCEVNYDYPVRIERYGSRYRTGKDLMGYWRK